ncbi:MAG TPA: outer membrane lipoprotein-sorting protein, partial [Spirochaetia bacterium]|nr:outer membrane lipoprotein-sorting protein [Spirochaetia bacterium]
EGVLGKYPVYILTLKAKNDEVSYPMMKLSVRKDKPLALKEEDYSLSNRLMRTVLYPPKYIEVAGRTVYSQMLIEDDLNVGERSALSIADVSVARLPDATFSKAFLDQSSK